jgi:hypothetical protein
MVTKILKGFSFILAATSATAFALAAVYYFPKAVMLSIG